MQYRSAYKHFLAIIMLFLQHNDNQNKKHRMITICFLFWFFNSGRIYSNYVFKLKLECDELNVEIIRIMSFFVDLCYF